MDSEGGTVDQTATDESARGSTADPDAPQLTSLLRGLAECASSVSPLVLAAYLREAADRLEAGPRPISADDPEPAVGSVIWCRYNPEFYPGGVAWIHADGEFWHVTGDDTTGYWADVQPSIEGSDVAVLLRDGGA